jgi:pimeloyl-ACP methyl ester carboxylesterase
MFEFLADRADATPNIALHCGFGDLAIEIRADGAREYAMIGRDRVAVTATPPDGEPDLVFAASAEAWREFLGPEPGPGFQTLTAMRRTGNLEVSGDYLKFHQNLLLLELLFGLSEPPAAPPPLGAPVIEPVTGRYLRLDIEDRPHRLYFEEAGEGIPLLCLHTAGADGRQFRALLNDPAVTGRFRVIAFDLPWHGKSSPPPGFEAEVYRLTTDGYLAVVMAVKAALGLVDPVVMGCSIGGRAVLHLALRHGSEFRAAIGLQSALYAEADPLDALHRPDVHGGKTAGASMAGMIAPQSPNAERWETMWHYMQGGPGVFLGDLHYYFVDGDLRNRIGGGLGPDACPIYLLSGEYDVSATPEMGRELADAIRAVHFEVMPGMGHFPMSENPEAFRRYLLPVLDAIAGGA